VDVGGELKYDVVLVNGEPIENAYGLEVKPGRRGLLRLMGAASATNFFIDTGKLEATIVATDGEDVEPLKGNFFQLSTAQRLDLLVTIPPNGGVFPVLALAEGSTLQAGVLLSTPGAKNSKRTLANSGQQKTAAFDKTHRSRLF